VTVIGWLTNVHRTLARTPPTLSEPVYFLTLGFFVGARPSEVCKKCHYITTAWERELVKALLRFTPKAWCDFVLEIERRPVFCACAISGEWGGLGCWLILISVPRLTAPTLHAWTSLGVFTFDTVKHFV